MFKNLVIGLFGSTIALSVTTQAAPLYNLMDLGTLGGNMSVASGINNSGQVTGWSTTAEGYTRAFITSPSGRMTDLGVLYGGRNSKGYAINDLGQVTGWATTQNDVRETLFVSTPDGQMKGICLFCGDSRGYGINSTGQVVGTYSYQDSSGAFVSDSNNQIIPLVGRGEAKAINDSGQIVGWIWVDGVSFRAFITDSNGLLVDLGTLGGQSSQAMGINNLGQVVGGSSTADGKFHAFMTALNGEMIDLGIPEGREGSVGNAINIHGQVVGRSWVRESSIVVDYIAVVSDNGELKDLNSLLVAGAYGWKLSEATGINDAGQITGWGYYNGKERAFLLTAVPIPAAIWLFVSGLGLLGFRKLRE